MRLRIIADDRTLEGSSSDILHQMRNLVPFRTFATNGEHRTFLADQALAVEGTHVRADNDQVLLADLLASGLIELVPPLDDEAYTILRLLPPQ